MDPRRLLPFFLALAALATIVTVGLVIHQRSSDPAAGPPVAPPGGSRENAPADVLAGWDARRAEAWSRGDVAGLRGLYVTGSRTGRADARMLAAYVDRGLHVDGLTTQVLELEVVEEATDRVTVRVTDRVVGGVIEGEGTTARLPRDRPTTRTVVLERIGDEWLVASVRDQPSAAASTSRTSTSWKS